MNSDVKFTLLMLIFFALSIAVFIGIYSYITNPYSSYNSPCNGCDWQEHQCDAEYGNRSAWEFIPGWENVNYREIGHLSRICRLKSNNPNNLLAIQNMTRTNETFKICEHVNNMGWRMVEGYYRVS